MVYQHKGCRRLFLAFTLFLAAFAAAFLPRQCLATTEGEEGLTVPRDTQPVWSPGGTKIAFVSTRNGPGGVPNGPENIWVVNADGTNMRQLTFDGFNEYPTWSPDGAKIAFQAGAQIWQVDLASATVAEITKGDRGGFKPDWHPTDSSRIACWFNTSGHDNNIYLIDPQTCLTELSGRRTLLRRDGTDRNARWSRDGTRLAFVGETKDPEGGDSTWHLMTMQADGTGVQTRCAISQWTTRLSWFPDGTRILIDDGKVCNLTTGEITSLFGEYLGKADISRDGQYVAYADWVGCAGHFLFVRNIDGSGKRQITFP